jgi:hypothetical protein
VRAIALDFGIFGEFGDAFGHHRFHRSPSSWRKCHASVTTLVVNQARLSGSGRVAPDARQIPLHQHAANIPDDSFDCATTFSANGRRWTPPQTGRLPPSGRLRKRPKPRRWARVSASRHAGSRRPCAAETARRRAEISPGGP